MLLLVIAKQNEKGMAVLSPGERKGAVWRYHASCTGNGRKGIVKLESMRIYREPLDLMISGPIKKQEEVKSADRQRLFSERRNNCGQTILKSGIRKISLFICCMV